MTGERLAMAQDAAREACGRLGVDDCGGGFEMVRVGTSVLLRLPAAGLLARVDDRVPVARAQRQVAVAAVLEAVGVPAVRLAGALADAQPVVVEQPDGAEVAVTLWRWEPHAPGEASVRDVGELARRLHHETAELAAEQPTFWKVDPFAAVGEQLEAIRSGWGGDTTELDLLEEVAGTLGDRWDEAERALGPPVLVHGDLHTDNVLVTEHGAVLADLELAGLGPRLYDLVPTVVATRRYGAPVELLDELVAAYGAPLPLGDPHLETLVETYELWVTLWAVANRNLDAVHGEEAKRRVDRWRDPDSSATWTLR